MRIALAQLNQTLGDLAGNARAIAEAVDRAAGADAALVVTPELSLCGYPPEDLLLRPAFIDACAAGASSASTARSASPTTPCSTRSATSRRAPRPACSSSTDAASVC